MSSALLVAADAEAVVAHDASGAGPQNLNVFMPPTPRSAHEAGDPTGDVLGDAERVGNALRSLGWHEIEGARGNRTFASGLRRASVGTAGDGSIELTLTWDRGWVLVLPSATALLGAAVLLVGVGRRRGGRGTTSSGPGAMP